MRVWELVKNKMTRFVDHNTYYQVVYADDLPLCRDCLEPWCPKCEDHYADCLCIKPHENDVDYIQWQGKLFGRRLINGK